MNDVKRINVALEEFSRIRKAFDERKTNQTINALVLGRFGSGKTYSLRTAPKPVLIHSFDPGGSKSLRHEVKKGTVIVDSSFETDERASPKSYLAWEKEFANLKRKGVFENVGTYVIDSITTFSDALLKSVVAKDNRTGQPAQLQDYLVQIETLKAIARELTALPCHFIATGHITAERDEVSGKMESFPLVTGKLREYLPLLFDEVYIARTKKTAKGLDYSLLTQPEGIYNARSRWSAGGLLDPQEPQDYKEIIKKVGLPYEDKQYE